MLVQQNPPLHLTYCLNIHPAQTWAQCLAAVREHALEVRRRVAPGRPFALGLRLSAAAAAELAQPAMLDDFKTFLREHGLYVFTINGFPYGAFHGERVKEHVYAPDWRDPLRRDYTLRLCEILAELLPAGMAGSISTVPLTYKAWLSGGDDLSAIATMLAETAAHLAAIEKTTGRDICIALEPEPDCLLETTAETIGFLTRDLPRLAAQHLMTQLRISALAAEQLLRRHVGVCLDTAHAAVEFEDPAAVLRQYQQAGVRVAKVQLSAALAAKASRQALHRLGDFADQTYLHQVKRRTADGSIRSYADLEAAISTGEGEDDLRVHFHVPLFFAGDGVLSATSDLLRGEFAAMLRGGACPQLELETYTFGVLPDEYRTMSVTDAIAREYEWVLKNILTR